ncbi:MAG TPA: PQQ-binding-like beta-propeller repeat protein [Bacteroidales bacterium]|nr:PQQ-binding-like beta-propeller repeat protein [Bacteroidales bacterium]
MKNQFTFFRTATVFFAALMTIAATNLQAQGWNTGPGGNSLRNGQSEFHGPTEPTLLWSGSLNSVIAQQAVCDGDYLAMTRMHSISDVLQGTKIVMHNLQTGDTLWTASLPVDFPATDWRSRVSAINDGRVYCTRSGNANESYLYALDVETGTILWKSEDVMTEGTTEGLTFEPNGDPIVGSMYYLTRFSKETGEVVWRTQRQSYDGGSSAIVSGGYVYTTINLFNMVGLAAFDLETGELLRTSEPLVGGFVNQLGIFADNNGMVYLPHCQNVAETDSLFALVDDGNSIQRLWAVAIPYTPFATFGVGPDETIYAYNRVSLMRFDAQTGAAINLSKEIFFVDAYSPRMAIDANGIIYVTNGGTANGMLYSFNADLTLRWELSAPYGSATGPILGKDGTLVLAGKGTDVRAFVGSEPTGVVFSEITEGILVASPNPATEVITFTFLSPDPGINELQIFDMNGKLIRQLTLANGIVGKHQIDWDLSDSYGNRVHEGVYICRYASASSAGVVKCIVSK